MNTMIIWKIEILTHRFEEAQGESRNLTNMQKTLWYQQITTASTIQRTTMWGYYRSDVNNMPGHPTCTDMLISSRVNGNEIQMPGRMTTPIT